MFHYSTCAGCGGLLHVTDNLNHHNGEPPCTPTLSKIEQLTQDWLAAAQAEDNQTADNIEAQIEVLDNRPPRLLDAALTYAAWGWKVFPLKPQSKQPATRHGFKDAHTDPDRIRDWWTRHPDHNIGLPTGLRFDVIDIDVPEGAYSYLQLLDEGKVPDSHGQVATSSGGTHLYVIHKPANGNRAGVRPGIDYRGAGGYVVAPPSTLGPKGRSWSWAQRPSPLITGIEATHGR